MSLAGKVAVVTGGGSGMGRACSIQLARDGAAVAVWDLNEAMANETVALIIAEGGRAIACAGDATDAVQIAVSAKRTRGELGSITILVNNAAITAVCPFLDVTSDMWDRMMRINVKGPFLCTQEILPDMLAAKAGRIINISSSSAQGGIAYMSHYASSKGGVIALTKALAIEFAETGITVNSIAPGFIDTPMLRGTGVDIPALEQTAPMKRTGQPHEIAATCAFLASPGAAYMTGQTLGVNGGVYIV